MRKFLIFICFISTTFSQSFFWWAEGNGGIEISNIETQAWYNKVTMAGGTASQNTLTALDVFFKQLADSSIRDKIIRANLFCGNDTASCFTPQIISDNKDSSKMGYERDLNYNFTPTDYSEGTGLGDASNTNKYLRTGIILSDIPETSTNNAHLSFYSLTSTATATQFLLGCYKTNYTTIWCKVGQIQSRINSSSGNAFNVVNHFGLFTSTRLSVAKYKVYKDGKEVQSEGTGSTAEPTVQIYVFALNLDGTPASYTNLISGGYIIGLGLDPIEARKLNNIIEAFEDAIGRGVQ